MGKITTWKFIFPNAYRWKGRNKIIKPGQIFTAVETDLPVELRSKVIPIESIASTAPTPVQKVFERIVNFVKPEEPIVTPKVETVDPTIGSVNTGESVQVEFKEHVGKDYTFVDEVPKVDKIRYRIKERNGGEYWDVLDSNGKIINEQHLNRDEAFEMLKSLRT